MCKSLSLSLALAYVFNLLFAMLLSYLSLTDVRCYSFCILELNFDASFYP